MSDLLGTSVSGLLAFQRALNTTSNNVANAATPGYSVQKVNFSEQQAQPTASGYIGSGVRVDSTTRAYDELLAGQVRTSQSGLANFNTYATQAAQVDNMLSASATGITASLQTFVNALQAVANSPAATPQRQALLSQAQALAQQLQNYQSQLTTFGAGIETRIGTTVAQINSLASGIATLNGQIAAGLAATGQTPNDLLDKRDSMLDQLSQYITVNTSTQSDGSMNVYVGTGQPLVTGSASQSLSVIPGPYNASMQNIGISSGGGTATDITPNVSGGTLGGLLAVRSQIIIPTGNTLGQFSVGLATIVNQAQAVGMDLTGAPGKAMFTVGAPQSAPASTNSGTASLSVTRGSLAALTADDYQLRLSGGTWQLTDQASGKNLPMSGAGTSTNPFVAAGVVIAVNGVPQDGDSFQIRPTAAATAGLVLQLTSPAQLAAASLVSATAGATNAGTSSIAAATVTNPALYAALTYRVSFTAPSQYQVTDPTNTVVATGTYTSGTPIGFNGQQLTLSGVPATGDAFTIAPNNPANTGDNSNAFAMIDALGTSTLNGGTTSLTGVANNLVSQIGVQTQHAQASAAAQQAVNKSALDTRNNYSGVNLDEEAARMVQFQQAYQACAQMIQVSGTVFNSLMSAIRG